MNKYYTPELNELHYGMEIEVYNSNEKYFFEGAFGWHKSIIEFGVFGDLLNLQKLIIDKQIRVKHLDREDIESLGYQYVGIGMSIETLIFRNEKEREIWFIDGERITLFAAMLSNLVLFTGKVKNKSELIVLLKQTGIN